MTYQSQRGPNQREKDFIPENKPSVSHKNTFQDANATTLQRKRELEALVVTLRIYFFFFAAKN
jgi:hypothetical protein